MAPASATPTPDDTPSRPIVSAAEAAADCRDAGRSVESRSHDREEARSAQGDRRRRHGVRRGRRQRRCRPHQARDVRPARPGARPRGGRHAGAGDGRLRDLRRTRTPRSPTRSSSATPSPATRTCRRHRQRRRREARLVGRHGRSRQGHRHRQVLRDLHQRARRLLRHHRARLDRPDHRHALRHCASRWSPSRTWSTSQAAAARPSRHRASCWRWSAARWAACRRSRGRRAIPSGSGRASASRPRRALGAQAIAFNEVGRQAILGDPRLRGRRLLRRRRSPQQGLAIARMVGHITYLSRRVDAREVRPPAAAPRRPRVRLRRPSSRSRATCAYQGRKFVERFDANTYLYMTKCDGLLRPRRRLRLRSPRRSPRRPRASCCSRSSSDWLFPRTRRKGLVDALRRPRARSASPRSPAPTATTRSCSSPRR